MIEEFNVDSKLRKVSTRSQKKRNKNKQTQYSRRTITHLSTNRARRKITTLN